MSKLRLKVNKFGKGLSFYNSIPQISDKDIWVAWGIDSFVECL